MSQETKEIIVMIIMGILGVSVAMFIRMQKITDANDNLDLRQVVSLFIRKCWASYGASITGVIIFAFAHTEIVGFLANPDVKIPARKLVEALIVPVVLSSSVVGFLLQYGAYWALLSKLDAKLKRWSGNPPEPEPAITAAPAFSKPRRTQ